ncbi:MAG: cytochrome P450 [Rhodospirillaceae bacterium]|nr:cytochrome P450 [Rhodospirillaceae bacterium]
MNSAPAAVIERAGVPNLDCDPFSDKFLENPYPYHDQIREAGPLVWLSRYGIWATARHDEASEVLKDYKRFCSSAGVGIANFKTEKPFRPPSLLIEADPPEHTRARNVMGHALSQKNISALQEKFEADAVAIIDAALEKGDIDGMDDIAIAYPIKVFPDVVGLGSEGRENLLIYGNQIFNIFGPPNRLFKGALEKIPNASAWVTEHCKRDVLAQGSIGQIIYEGAEAGDVSPDEAGLLVRSLLSAGVDTTVSGIGNMLNLFAQNPDQWALLRSDPSLINFAFEEAIRVEGPVQTFFRTSAMATELSGIPVGDNEKLVLFLGGANRDPRRWDDPDRFDIARKPSGHLAWGNGVHRCVGMRITQMEAEAILKAMLARIELIEPTGPAKIRLNNTLRVLDSLPLRLTGV